MLTWGYGPLVLVNSTPTLQASSGGAGLRIGELSASDYTIDAIEHINMYHLSSPTSLVALGGDQTKFDTIYGSDVAQQFRNIELVNATHPFAGSVASPTAIEAAVPALPGATPVNEKYNSVEIAVHFPQGLRKIKAQGENAGKSYALTDSANGGSYPVKVKYEWDIGSGWTPITSITTAGESSGVVVYGTENKKDAFTKTHTINLTTPTTNAIKVRATRLTGGWSDAPAQGTTEYTNFTANSGVCHVWTVQQQTRNDDNYTYIDSYDVEEIDSSITTRAACDAALGRWVQDSSSLIKRAEDWRFAHQVNLLSLTVRRNAKPTKNPVDTTITKTAIRIKSSQELNGQLEGINAVVQTYGRDWKGGNSLTVDKSNWIFGAIDNPASLLLYILTSPANPRQIDWADVENRVDLSKLQYWHYYCQQKGFKFNSIVAQQRSLLDVMRDICAAGRASPSLVDGKWTVIIDEPKANIVQHFSPHNSWGFEGTRVLNKLPDGLRINYYDESDNYKESELILYKTGYNEDGSGGKTPAKLFESIQLPGVTNKTLVEDHARWHMAQGKLRREIYSLNTDLEYIICNRGDRVTVTHDVPMWGAGSGRIKTRLDGKTYALDEAVLINPSKEYQIKVRSNTYPLENTVGTIVDSFSISGSIRSTDVITATVTDTYHPFSVGDILNISGCSDTSYNNATAKVIETGTNWFKYESVGTNSTSTGGTINLTQGLYQKITLASSIGTKSGTSVNLADSGDLFLFGETNRISNDLLVLGIDPTNSKSARITLMDYGVYVDAITPSNSYNIFNDYLTLSESTVFATNITLPESLTSLQLTDIPTITSLSSNISDAEIIAPGTYRYRIRVSYSNSSGTLSQYIRQVECQYDLVGVNDPERSIIVKYDANTIYIPDVDVGKTYKVKLRYIAKDGITGPWTAESIHTVNGKTNNLDNVNSITAIQKNKFIELNPIINPVPLDFKQFEIRVWKTTKQTTDFWDYTSDTANGLINSSGLSAQPTVFKIVKTTGICTVDLTEFAQPRISEAGVIYNIACRAIDTAGNYSKYSALTFVTVRTLQPPAFKIFPQAGTLNIHVQPPIVNNKPKDDIAGLKIWVYNTSKTIGSLTSGDLKYDSTSLKASISNLNVEKTLYYRLALTSVVDPTVYTISNEYTYIPRANIVDSSTDFPPTPMGMLVSAGINVIFVEIPQTSKIFNNVSVTSGSKALTVSSTTGIQIGQRLRILNTISGSPALGVPAEIVNIAGSTLTLAYAATGSGTADIIHSQDIKYNYSNYTPGTDLYKFASSTHQSTVVYGIKINNLDQVVTFEQAKDSILGEFGGYEDAPATPKTIFTIPADPGSNYALFFKFKNRAGNLSINADGPYNIGTGQDAKALINMLSQAITEGTLYNGLQTRIASVDRGDERVAVEVSKLNNQYTVRIDAGGVVSGYGLASSTLGDGTVESEFGIHADKFYITAPADVGPTAPTTNLFHGKVWVDTSTTAAINEAAVTGVSVYYNTYKPTIHNTVTFPDDTTYQYWEIKTESGIKSLTGQSTAQPTIGTAYNGYTYRGDTWNPEYDYTAKDYIFDITSGDYYICKKSYNAVKITDLATKNPSLRGVFTATGATFAIDSTVYIVGEETAIAPHTKKLGSSYSSSGTFYYIIALPASGQFQLALKKRGDAILTNIRGTRKYYDAKAATPGWVTALDKQTMLPFIVKTTPTGTEGDSDYVPAGTYINSAYIANASIGTAQIKDASITSAKIKDIKAEQITTGILNAELINTKSLVLDKLDLATMLGNLDGSWTIACPYNSLGPVQRTLTLIPGNYEIILYANFAMEGETSNSAGTYLTSCEVTAEVAGLGARKSVGTSEVKGEGFWRKIVTHTDLNLELTNDAVTVNTQPTVSTVSASGSIGEGGGSWDVNVTPTLSGGSYKVTGKDIQVKSGGKAQPVVYQTRMNVVKQTTFTINSGVNVECQFKLTAVKPGSLGGDTWIVHAGSMAVLNYLGNSAVPTYTLTAAGGSVDEGSTLKFTLTTTDVSPGTGFSWEIEHVGSVSNNSHYIDLVDDTVQMTNGFVNLDNTGKAEFEIKARADKTTNPTSQQKQFKINVTRPGSGIVATSSTITVNDSSLGPTYSLAFSAGAVDEGSAVTGTVSSTNPPVDGTVLTWIVKPSSGFDSDKYFAARSGTVTLVSGGGTFTVTPLEDKETNTGKTFQVELRDSTGTLVLAAGTTVTVNDTSQSLGAASTGTTESGMGTLDGGYFYGGDDSGRVDGNVYVYFYPDGTWQAVTSNGLKTDGNWFSPTTPGIGSLYNISITGSRSPGSTGSATGSPNLTNQSLSTFQNCYAIATSYKCVDPMTPIMVDHDGTSILAKDLIAGDKVYTMHEFTKYWDYYTVKEVQTVEQPKKLVTFGDGSTLFVSHSHKFYSDRKWINLSNLRVGDYVASYNQGMKEIISIEDMGVGQVVSIEVEDAHTYIANNIISHNIKFGSALTYFATSIYEFTATITKVGGGDTQTATFILEAYSGLDLR
jgi:hypothetical protein